MKRVRTRACGLILLFLVLAGCAGTPESRRDKFLAKGKEFLEKKDYTRALLEFRNASQVMPKDAEPYYQTGLAAAASTDIRTAAKAFRKAIDLNPKHSGAQLKLSQLMATTNDETLLKDAHGRLAALLESGSESADTLNALALTELKLGNTDSAVQNLERALAQSPGELTSTILLAQAKLRQNDSKGAEEVLKKACAEAPKSADARTMLGKFYVAQSKMPEAEAEFQRALHIDPANGPALMDLALVQLRAGRKQEAEQTLKRLKSIPASKSVYAMYLFQEGRRDEAVREFERVAKEDPEDRKTRTYLVAVYRAVGRGGDANNVLTEALKKNPKDGEALLQRAELLIEAKKYAEAERDANEVRRLRPNAPELHYILAMLHKARGATRTYRQELSETLRLNPALLSVRVELVQNLVNAKEARAALELLNAAPEFQKSSTPLLVQRNWAHWTLGDLGEMRKGIDRGLSQGRAIDLLLQDGLLKLRTGDASGARAALEEALKLNPTDLRALQMLSQSYTGKNEAPMALQKVKEYAARQPASAPVQHFLGSLLMASGDRAGARSAFGAAKTVNPRFVNAELSLVQLDILDKKLDEAQKRVHAILAADSSHTTARFWLANLQLMAGNHNESIQNFRKVVDANPGNAEALNNLAYLLAETRSQLDEALKYAEKAVELAPEHADFCDTLGWVLYRKGIYNSAVKYLERANSGKSHIASKYHLAMAYAKAGDIDRGRSTLQAALKLNPNVPEAKAAQEVVGGRDR